MAPNSRQPSDAKYQYQLWCESRLQVANIYVYAAILKILATFDGSTSLQLVTGLPL